MDYSTLYRDLNQISIGVDRVEFSEVMVIHRMYVRLSDLNVGELPGAGRVKRVYVFADVVELAPRATLRDQMHMPGSVTVIVLCRLLQFPIDGSQATTLRLPFMQLHARVIEQNVKSEITATDGMNWGIYIYGEKVERSPLLPSNAILAVWADRCTITSARHNHVNAPGRIISTFTLGSGVTGITSMHGEPSLDPWNGVSLDSASPTAFSALPRQSRNISFTSIPVEVVTDPSILLGMQTTVLIAELVKVCRPPSPDMMSAVAEHALWLNDVLLQVVQKESQMQGTAPYNECLALLGRIECVMKIGRFVSVVPQLQYRMYGNLIKQMAQVAQNYDQEFKQFKLFIIQNQIFGSYLLQQNKAFADRELQMESFHSAVISQRRQELNTAIAKMERMSLQMEEENRAMEQAQKEMEEGLREFQNRQVARAVFAVLKAVAMIALAFVTAGATAPGAAASAGQAVSIAGQAAQALRRVVEILEGLEAVMEVVAAVKDLVDSLEQVGHIVGAPEMPDMPSEADWSIFVNEIEAVAEGMPTEVSEVPAWKAKCKNMAALGREMSITAVQISELQYEIWVQGLMRDIARSHADRLAAIQPVDLTNHLEMATHMDMRTTSMLIGLLNMLRIQNAALMYEYLLTPTELTVWPLGMDTVANLLIAQENAALVGLIQLGPSSNFTSRHVVKGIPVSLLLDGEDWEFEIPVQAGMSSFPFNWTRVRIRHLEMQFAQEASGGDEIIHQPSTRSGIVYILLQGSTIFHDRRRDEVMTFQAADPLNFQYAYRLDTGEATLTNEPSEEFANTFMQMTPFTRWRLRLSASASENAELAFPTATAPDSTTEVVITFHVTAIRQVDWRQEEE
uniref:IPD083Cc n=1 Tax=Adiantum trapeziforme TaxID=1481318 RepID=A0A3S6ZRA7_ADITR|nr:IPD083Cc [Adiantum trapeziforme]